MKDLNKFNKTKFEHLISMMNYWDANRVISFFKNYLNEYPNDVSAYLYYAIMLIKLGLLDEALEVLNLEVVLTSNNFYNIRKRGYAIIKILISQEKYEECYQYLLENNHLFSGDDELNLLVLFLKKRLNLLTFNYDLTKSYIENQIISYQEELALNHIVLNHKNQGYLETKSQFNPDFPIREVFSKIKNLLPNENRIYDELVVDYYIFKCNNNGRSGSKSVNYIKVITLVNTNQIITMFPMNNQGKLPYIDLDLELNNDSLPIKKISQIEKFNRRYKK